MAKLQNMRGLQNFISEIRACSGKDEERARIDKELGKIRKKFATSDKISEYDKKKYVWKLLYVYMLGYPVEFGHKQASDLIAAGKYAEKQVGYMACSILLTENDEFLRLVINSIRNDITGRNEPFQCLALNFIGSVGGSEMASLLTADVAQLLTNSSMRPIVRKKAALALLRLLRKSSDNAEDILPAETWAPHIIRLLEEPEIGVLLGATALLLGVVSRSYHGYEGAVPRLVSILGRMRAREVGDDYTYYGIASPWLQVKTLRLLQYFPPPADAAVLRTLNELLRKIIRGYEPVKNLDKNNAQQAIVLEAVALALALDSDAEVLQSATALLAKFISMREPNIKYLGLETLMRLVEVPAVVETIDKHQKSITGALKEADISVRRRALDLLFAMATPTNAPGITEELLTYLTIADFSMREELVLKTAVLAEKFHPDMQWYIDTMITLIERGGEFVTRDVWHSTVQLVTNHPELHEYAARQTLESLKRGANHDAMVGAAAAIVGEHGHLVKDTSDEDQFELLSHLFLSASSEGKAQLLSAFLRISLRPGLDPAVKQRIEAVFEKHKRYLDPELQQRALEYDGLSKDEQVGRRNVLPLPHWEKRKSLLIRRLAQREGATTDERADKPAWMLAGEGGGVSQQRAVELQSPPPVPEANGAAEPQPEPEPEPEAQPEPEPAAPEVPLIGIDDDDGSAPLANGYPKPSNPLDELLSGMAIVPAGPAAAPQPHSPPPAASAAAHMDPFAARPSPAASAAHADSNPFSSPPQQAAGPAQPQQQAQTQQPLASVAPPYSQAQPPPAYSQAPAAARGSPAGSGGYAAGVAARSAAGSAGGSAPESPQAGGSQAQYSGPPPSPLSQASSATGQPATSQALAMPPTLPPPQLLGDVGEWFRRLTAADTGILYEDTYLQVGVKQGYQGPGGQVQLFFGNKADVALGRLICAVPPQPVFAFQLGPVPPYIEPKKQVVVTLGITALTPFVNPPRLNLGYTLGAGGGAVMSESLALPAVATKFVVPPRSPPPPDAFFQRWRAIAGPPHKLSERVTRQTPLLRGAIASVLAALKLADLQGFDPQPENAVAAGSFCFAPPGLPPQQVLLLVRIEVDVSSHAQFQVTVASPDVQLTAAAKNVLLLQLAGMPSA